MVTQPVETSDDFDSAFASFAAGSAEPKPDDDAGTPHTGADAAGGGDDPADGAAGVAVVDPGVSGAADSGSADDGGAGEPAAKAPANDDATDALIGRLAAMVKDAPQPQVEAPAAVVGEQAEIYTTEEKDFLSKYDEDWADVTKGEALKRRAEHSALVQYVFGQVAQELRPYLETIEVMSNRAHLGDIKAQVGDDYEDVRDKVVAWALDDKQPMYLQKAYKEVIQSGTADEVNDLINRYREATGQVKTPSPAPTKQTELSDDAKKAAQALAPVSTKRSAIPQDDSSDDFDAAFKRFATGFNRS